MSSGKLAGMLVGMSWRVIIHVTHNRRCVEWSFDAKSGTAEYASVLALDIRTNTHARRLNDNENEIVGGYLASHKEVRRICMCQKGGHSLFDMAVGKCQKVG